MELPAGLVKIAEGREAEMFALDDERVLRLYRANMPREWIEQSIAVTQAVGSAGIRVPATYGTQEVDGRIGVIMERVPGKDLLDLIARKPWRVWWIGKLSGRVHAEMAGVSAPASLESNHERFARRMRQSAAVPAAYRAAALRALEALPEGDRLYHGDFHPGNMMLKGGEPVVIDWSNAARGVPEADYVRTSLMLNLGEPPPGTPLLIRVAARFARSLLRAAYQRGYRGTRALDADAVTAWRLPIAVARLTEEIPEERPKLFKYIDSLLASGQ